MARDRKAPLLAKDARNGAPQIVIAQKTRGPQIVIRRRYARSGDSDLVMIVVFLVPTAFGLPAMLFAVPPLVVPVPTTLAFGVEIAAAFLGLAAVLAPFMDRSVQSGLGFFDLMLAPRTLIGANLGRRGYEQHERRGYCCCYCCLSNSSNQGSLLSVSFRSLFGGRIRPACWFSISVQCYTAR